MQHCRPMTITETSSSSRRNYDETAECIISTTNDDDQDDATLYFRCFGAIIGTDASISSDDQNDVDHPATNHTFHHHPTEEEQCLQQQHSPHQHPHFVHHPHYQTTTKDGNHHLWRTRTAAAKCSSQLPLDITSSITSQTGTRNVNETSVNIRFSDSLEMKRRKTDEKDEDDCDRLSCSRVFQEIPPPATTPRCPRRPSAVSSTTSSSSSSSGLSLLVPRWLTLLAICAASLQPTLAGKSDSKIVVSHSLSLGGNLVQVKFTITCPVSRCWLCVSESLGRFVVSERQSAAGADSGLDA